MHVVNYLTFQYYNNFHIVFRYHPQFFSFSDHNIFLHISFLFFHDTKTANGGGEHDNAAAERKRPLTRALSAAVMGKLATLPHEVNRRRRRLAFAVTCASAASVYTFAHCTVTLFPRENSGGCGVDCSAARARYTRGTVKSRAVTRGLTAMIYEREGGSIAESS